MRMSAWFAPVLVGTALLSTVASAHHSTAAYDFTKTVTLKGTIRSFQWANPHNYAQLVVSDGKGAKAEWSIEAGTPATATRQGWSKSSLKPGDKVTMEIAPMKDGSPGGTLRVVTLPDGKILKSVASDPRVTNPFQAIPSLKRVEPK